MNAESLRELIQRLQQGLPALQQQIPRVLADPRAYSREAMLLALIAVLLLLFVVFIFFALMDTVRELARRRSAAPRLKRRDLWARIAIAVACVVALVGLLALVPLVPAAGAGCAACHEVSAAVSSWESGSHPGVSCYACHAGRSVGGALTASTGGVARVMTGRSAVPPQGVLSSACVSCHEDVAQGTTSGPTVMRHSDVIEAGMSCLECHPWVGHEEIAGGVEQARSVMGLCLTCHDGLDASAECETCHADPPLDATSGRVSLGATGIEPTCRGCHSAELTQRCIDCHGLEMPHPQEFMSQHAGASQDDPSICAQCHDSASTSQGCGCHTDVNVHGTYSEWFPRHGTAAIAGGQLGCNCHKLAFCARCHETNPYN